MTVKLKLFAVLRDRAGVAESPLHLPDGCTVAQAKGPLLQQFPTLGDFLERCAYAINRNYVRPDAVLHEGDDLALIPPVSGG